MGYINACRALSAISMRVTRTEVVFLLHAQGNINFVTKVKNIYMQETMSKVICIREKSISG